MLLVDDEADTRAMLEMWLSEQGFAVSVAANGIEALARTEEQAPDVIVTDQCMPRMTGLELCSALRGRAKTRHIPIILYSGHALPPTDGLYDRAILKPASLSRIADEISSVMSAGN